MRSSSRPLAALAAFLALADTGVVALALPPILRQLHTTVAGVAAVLGVYAVVMGVALLPAEALGRRHGPARLGVAGATLFAAASLGCGLAGSLGLLLALRAVQAAGGAAVLVAAFSLLRATGAHRRTWELAALLGTAAGPALGGALTQAFGWRSIFLAQAPVALAAAVAWREAGPVVEGERPVHAAGGPAAPAEDRESPVPGAERTDAERPVPAAAGRAAPAERWPAPAAAIPRAAALALLSGALACALFLTVLLLVTGWSDEPLGAAAAVSTIPLAALLCARVRGPAATRALGGALLVAAGSACLAFLPGASVAWTIPPQALVGAGLGLALPALAGELLPERTPRDAAGLLSVRHVGIALALVLLAPIAQHELDTTLQDTRERGAAVILDAQLPPGDKLRLAPVLASTVDTEQPRAGLRRVFSDHRGEIAPDRLPAYDDLTRRADDVLVRGVDEGFRVPYLIGAALALLAAAAMASALGAATRRRALVAVAVALAVPACFAAAAAARRPAKVELRDPCAGRALPRTGGLTGFAQDAALNLLDRAACRAGSSREELVLALVDQAEARRYQQRHGFNPRSITRLLGLAIGN